MFAAGVAGGFINTNGFVVRKSSVLAGGPIFVTTFANLLTPVTFVGPYTPQGVDNYDPRSTEGYFIGVDGAAFSLLQVRRITNPGSASPTISGNIPITVATTSTPLIVPHLGNTSASGACAGCLDALDDRLFAAHIRN